MPIPARHAADLAGSKASRVLWLIADCRFGRRAQQSGAADAEYAPACTRASSPGTSSSCRHTIRRLDLQADNSQFSTLAKPFCTSCNPRSMACSSAGYSTEPNRLPNLSTPSKTTLTSLHASQHTRSEHPNCSQRVLPSLVSASLRRQLVLTCRL